VSRRHLDANIIHLEPGSRIQAHAGPDLDVLWHILQGYGQLMTEVGMLALQPGELLWLPRLSRREIAAGDEGLTYLTVHPRRPGITIQTVPQQT
jgi:quercetin dioxygenase-like cupin family protein